MSNDDGAVENNEIVDTEKKTAALFEAVQSNDETKVRALIAAGADVHRTDNEGKTALVYAVQRSHNENVVRALVDAGADVNRTDNEGKTALFYAVQGNSESLVHVLVEEGNSLTSSRDIYGRTPFFYAMTSKSQSIVRYFLEKKINMRIKDNSGMNFLSFLVDHCISKPADSQDETFICDRLGLLIQNGVKNNAVYEAIIGIIVCKCPLLFYSEINVPVFVLFLELAKTYGKENEDEIDNVLKIARKIVSDKTLCADLVPQIVNLLCELGADPNSADTNGNTALHLAVCLPFYGVSSKAIMDLLKQLEEGGATVDAKNHQSETPLLSCLTLLSDNPQLLDESNHLSPIKKLVEVCKFLIKTGSNVEETTSKGDSVLHLIMKLLQQILEWDGNTDIKDTVQVGNELFVLFSSTRAGTRVINNKDENLNSPLHLWALLEFPCQCSEDLAYKKSVFSNFMKEILEKLVDCGTHLEERNKHGQTPLHLCRTWTAVKLLLDAGAKPKVVDSEGRSPLIVAAQSKKLLKARKTSFYPDVEIDPKAFWITRVIKKGLDPWIVDKHGNSVFSSLIDLEAVDLAKAMIDVFCANKKTFPSGDKNTIACSILIILCKDNKPIHAQWKQEYVAKILKSLGRPLSEIKWCKASPLHLCCRNIVESPRGGSSIQSTVHWDIAQKLLYYKADCTLEDETGQSSLDIAGHNPELRELLENQENPVEIHNFTNWKPEFCAAERHDGKLKEVSKSTNCVKLEESRLWYHEKPIGKGTFGCEVYAGISVTDGREVAVKRICKENNSWKQETESLVKLRDCQQIVTYIQLFDDDKDILIIFELMEGNLSEFLNRKSKIELEERKILCKQLLDGVDFMHRNDIIHRHLRPINILILNSRSGQRQLKIAGFGLSCDINNTSPMPAQHNDVESQIWSSPEVLQDQPHSKESDLFSCGLVLHYIISGKHPYEPQTGNHQRTVMNIKNGLRNKWDHSHLCPESIYVLESSLKQDMKKRSTAKDLLGHPYFWSNDKKVRFLRAVLKGPGNPKVRLKWNEKSDIYKIVVGDYKCKYKCKCRPICNSWDKARTPITYREKMPQILEQMILLAEEDGFPVNYNTRTVWGLLHLIRNAHEHNGELVSDYVFLKYFPNLVVEVFKETKRLKWDEKHDNIKEVIHSS